MCCLFTNSSHVAFEDSVIVEFFGICIDHSTTNSLGRALYHKEMALITGGRLPSGCIGSRHLFVGPNRVIEMQIESDAEDATEGNAVLFTTSVPLEQKTIDKTQEHIAIGGSLMNRHFIGVIRMTKRGVDIAMRAGDTTNKESPARRCGRHHGFIAKCDYGEDGSGPVAALLDVSRCAV